MTTKRDDSLVMAQIWRRSPGNFFCVSTKSPTGKWKDRFFKRTEMVKARKFAQRLEDHDVYMGTHGYSKPRRHKDVSHDPCILYADLDETRPQDCEIKPTIAIESSRGRYVGYWITDEPASEELNRRLTYFLGADNSGWDRTQVLRVPGTYNHKYKKPQKVRVLWTDGPRYQIKRLEKMVPELQDDEGETIETDASDIYREYEKDLPRDIRREFTDPRPQRGKRSEVLWKMLNACLEAGMTEDEAFTLCWHSPWNKHAERRGGERQMRRELEKALQGHVGGKKKKVKKKPENKIVRRKSQRSDEPEPDEDTPFAIMSMDKVEEEEVDWIVPYMVAKGQTTIFEGDPGVGKSYFIMWMCIHFCDGKRLPWLDKKTPAFKGRVMYCDMENSAGSVTKVRLVDNGLKNYKNYVQLTEPFSVDDDTSFGRFEATIKQYRPDVVIIDPVNLYIGNADTYRASETQQALQHLKALSEEYHFALIIVRHLNKSNGGKALYAGNGSIAFAGVARVIATVGWHPDEADTRVVACTKNNISKFFGSFGYVIEGLPDTVKRKDRSHLTFEGHMSYSSDEIISTSNQREEGSLTIAVDLIKESLDKDGKVNYHSLLKNADSRSISEKSIKKAALELGLKKLTKGRDKNRKTYLVSQ